MTIRNVHLKLDDETYERAKAAAVADRRSVSNWIACTIERAVRSGPPALVLGVAQDISVAREQWETPHD